jgi:hypothetical protein
MSIALDQAEEKLEKVEKECRETKQSLERAENLQAILKQQLVWLFYYSNSLTA